jgi:hypothetical protein
MARRRPRLFSPSVFIRQGAIYKGFLGGNRGWTIVGVVLFGGRFVKRMLGRDEEVIATEKLQPGQFLRIEAIPMATKRQRRAAAESAPGAARSAS